MRQYFDHLVYFTFAIVFIAILMLLFRCCNSKEPIADFSYKPSNAYIGDSIHFTDQSLHAKSWHWDFGDGKSSDVQNPVHIYTAERIYRVTLTINKKVNTVNNIYIKSISVRNKVKKKEIVPVVIIEPENPKKGELVYFKDLTPGAYDWTWDFGEENGKSKDPNPAYVYKYAGSKKVKLTVKGDDFTSTATYDIEVSNIKTGSSGQRITISKPTEPVKEPVNEPAKETVKELVKETVKIDPCDNSEIIKRLTKIGNIWVDRKDDVESEIAIKEFEDSKNKIKLQCKCEINFQLSGKKEKNAWLKGIVTDYNPFTKARVILEKNIYTVHFLKKKDN